MCLNSTCSRCTIRDCKTRNFHSHERKKQDQFACLAHVEYECKKSSHDSVDRGQTCFSGFSWKFRQMFFLWKVMLTQGLFASPHFPRSGLFVANQENICGWCAFWLPETRRNILSTKSSKSHTHKTGKWWKRPPKRRTVLGNSKKKIKSVHKLWSSLCRSLWRQPVQRASQVWSKSKKIHAYFLALPDLWWLLKRSYSKLHETSRKNAKKKKKKWKKWGGVDPHHTFGRHLMIATPRSDTLDLHPNPPNAPCQFYICPNVWQKFTLPQNKFYFHSSLFGISGCFVPFWVLFKSHQRWCKKTISPLPPKKLFQVYRDLLPAGSSCGWSKTFYIYSFQKTMAACC